MKIRKLESEYDPDTTIMCRMINALKAARDVSFAYQGSGDFQVRCGDAILALANRMLGHIEAGYESEERKFDVEFDVKRSGVHHLTVTANDEAEAKRKAEDELRSRNEDWFSAKDTDFVAADVVGAKEVPNG